MISYQQHQTELSASVNNVKRYLATSAQVKMTLSSSYPHASLARVNERKRTFLSATNGVRTKTWKGKQNSVPSDSSCRRLWGKKRATSNFWYFSVLWETFVYKRSSPSPDKSYSHDTSNWQEIKNSTTQSAVCLEEFVWLTFSKVRR